MVKKIETHDTLFYALRESVGARESCFLMLLNQRWLRLQKQNLWILALILTYHTPKITIKSGEIFWTLSLTSLRH